ncbi:MAG: BolA/IbaG family iron-sulfur metabolism protein [Buchnera aphidicola (Nurudea shiraii)]
MITKEIQNLLKTSLSLKEIKVKGDTKHLEIIAIDNIFQNKSEVEKQKIIYTQLMNYITENKIHSISIKTYSIQEWKNKKITKK